MPENEFEHADQSEDHLGYDEPDNNPLQPRRVQEVFLISDHRKHVRKDPDTGIQHFDPGVHLEIRATLLVDSLHGIWRAPKELRDVQRGRQQIHRRPVNENLPNQPVDRFSS